MDFLIAMLTFNLFMSATLYIAFGVYGTIELIKHIKSKL